MSKRVAIVIGSPRSGSTLLGAMLGSHSRAAMLGEINRYATALRDRRAWFRKGRLCLLCDGPCPVWDDGVGKHFAWRHFGPSGDMWSRLPFARGPYRELFAVTGAQVLVDTSKSAQWAEQRLKDSRDWSQAEPHLIFVTRDARGSIASYLRKFPDVPIEEHIDRWVRLVEQSRSVYDAVDPSRRTRLSYEDLVDKPDATLKRLCDRLGLTFEPEMSEYWRHEHHIFASNFGTLSLIARQGRDEQSERLGVSRDQSLYDHQGQTIFHDQRWREELDAGHLEAIDRRAGPLNRAFGYE